MLFQLSLSVFMQRLSWGQSWPLIQVEKTKKKKMSREEEGKRKEVKKGRQTNEDLKMTCTSTSAHLLTASESDLAKLLRRRRRRRRSCYSQLAHINKRQYVTFSWIPASHTGLHTACMSLFSHLFFLKSMTRNVCSHFSFYNSVSQWRGVKIASCFTSEGDVRK